MQRRIVYDVPLSMVPDDVLRAVDHAFAAAEADMGHCGDAPIIWYRCEPGKGRAPREIPFRVLPHVFATGVFDPVDGSIWLQVDREPHQIAQSAYHEAVHRCQHSRAMPHDSDLDRDAGNLARAYWLRNWPDGGPEGVRMRLAKALENGVEWWAIRQ